MIGQNCVLNGFFDILCLLSHSSRIINRNLHFCSDQVWTAIGCDLRLGDRTCYTRLPAGFIGTKLTPHTDRRLIVPSASFSITISSWLHIGPMGATRRPPPDN